MLGLFDGRKANNGLSTNLQSHGGLGIKADERRFPANMERVRANVS